MKLTNIGTDYVNINEDNIGNEDILNIAKIHIIKLSFKTPDSFYLKSVLDLFPKTNRFVINDNIREYNNFFKQTSKKYYIENNRGVGLISFFRKNNKVLLNFNNLTTTEKDFILNACFEDVLKNLEVIQINKSIFNEKKNILNRWNGNVVVVD